MTDWRARRNTRTNLHTLISHILRSAILMANCELYVHSTTMFSDTLNSHYQERLLDLCGFSGYEVHEILIFYLYNIMIMSILYYKLVFRQPEHQQSYACNEDHCKQTSMYLSLQYTYIWTYLRESTFWYLKLLKTNHCSVLITILKIRYDYPYRHTYPIMNVW